MRASVVYRCAGDAKTGEVAKRTDLHNALQRLDSNISYLDEARRNAGDSSNWTGGKKGVNARTVTVRNPRRCQTEGIPTIDKAWLDQDSGGREGFGDSLLCAALTVEISKRLRGRTEESNTECTNELNRVGKDSV